MTTKPRVKLSHKDSDPVLDLVFWADMATTSTSPPVSPWRMNKEKGLKPPFLSTGESSEHVGHFQNRNDTRDQRLAISRWDASVFAPSCGCLPPWPWPCITRVCVGNNGYSGPGWGSFGVPFIPRFILAFCFTRLYDPCGAWWWCVPTAVWRMDMYLRGGQDGWWVVERNISLSIISCLWQNDRLAHPGRHVPFGLYFSRGTAYMTLPEGGAVLDAPAEFSVQQPSVHDGWTCHRH